MRWRSFGIGRVGERKGGGSRHVLRYSSSADSSSHFALLRLGDGKVIVAPCITVSARSAWRRGASRLWLNAIEAATAGVPLLRIAMHPVDAQHDDIRTRWLELIRRLLGGRTALTKLAAVTDCA